MKKKSDSDDTQSAVHDPQNDTQNDPQYDAKNEDWNERQQWILQQLQVRIVAVAETGLGDVPGVNQDRLLVPDVMI